MKPRQDLDIAFEHAAGVSGSVVGPLSKLAARNKAERAENFTFTAEDQELLSAVLGEVADPV